MDLGSKGGAAQGCLTLDSETKTCRKRILYLQAGIWMCTRGTCVVPGQLSPSFLLAKGIFVTSERCMKMFSLLELAAPSLQVQQSPKGGYGGHTKK